MPIRFLAVACLFLLGCTRNTTLPKADPKTDNGSGVSAPNSPAKTMKASKEDPNRHIPPGKVEPAPDLIPDPRIGGRAGAPNDTIAQVKKNTRLNWDAFIESLKLTDETKIQERLNAVTTLLGEKADTTIKRWVGSQSLHHLFKGWRLEILEQEGGLLQIRYSFFTPNQKDPKTREAVFQLPFMLSKPQTSAELEAEQEMIFAGDEKIKNKVSETFGKVTIRKLKTENDLLIVHERADNNGFGIIFHYDKANLGSLAVVAQAVGMEKSQVEFVKNFNLLNFIEVGRRKLIALIDPVISVIEKLPAAIEKVPELKAAGFGVFGEKMHEIALNPKDPEGGVLTRIIGYTKATLERILTVRLEEQPKEVVPMEDSGALLLIDKTYALQMLKMFNDEFQNALVYLKNNTDPKLNLKEIIDLVGGVKLDLTEASKAFDLIGREILVPVKANTNANKK